MRSPRPKEHLKRQDVWLVAAPGWRLASNKTITSSRLDGPLTLIEEEHSVGHLPGDPSGEMQVEGRTAQLAPGMSVTVEIKTGSRRIISYLLSPLMRYKQEILRER